MELIQFDFDIIIRLLVAAFFGGLVGVERSIHGRDAGLRTHLLVSLGSACFTAISYEMALQGSAGGFLSDPARIAAQIVTGIGFLGAGVIIKAGINVRGLTTAASLWVTAAMGMASGAGMYKTAFITVVITLVSLQILKSVESFYSKDFYRRLKIKTRLNTDMMGVMKQLNKKGFEVLHCDIRKDYDKEVEETNFGIKLRGKLLTDQSSTQIIQILEEQGIELIEFSWTLS